MYTRKNFKTKKALNEAVKAGEEIEVFSPGPFPCPANGEVAIEGPHFPESHTWYATVMVEDSMIVKVLV